MKTRAIVATLAMSAALTLSGSAFSETLNVGSTSTGVPFTYLNVKTNKLQGMMVDLIREVGKKAGFTPEVRTIDFASLIPALTSGRIDIISAAMLDTPKREKVISFSDPVLPYGEGLVVAKSDNTEYKTSLDSLKGKAIGVEQGTVYLDGLQKMGGFGKIQVYASLSDMMRDLELGRIKAGVGDKPIIAYQLSQGKFPKLKLSQSYKSQFGGSVAIGVRKDDGKLLARINGALAKLKDSGEIHKLAKKWNIE